VEIELSITKSVLAAELGTSGETLSRTLAHLRGQSLISGRGRRITVVSPAALSAFLEGSSNR
jgi:CRP/FNR family transcriptional regulator